MRARIAAIAVGAVLAPSGCDKEPPATAPTEGKAVEDKAVEDKAVEDKVEAPEAPAPAITHGPTPPPLAAGAERWHVVAQIGPQQVELLVDFDAAGKAATLGVPGEQTWGVPLQDVSVSDGKVEFTLHKPALPGADEVYVAKRDGDSATGSMKLAGNEFGFTMKKLAAGEAWKSIVKRPQTPKPPFPYEERELTAKNAKDGVVRAGTLTLPKGEGPFPAVILESGSGPVDRDGTLSGHKPYLVIADHLTRAGIAVLRTDDRGVGKSTGVDKDASYEDLTGDMLALVAALKKQPEVDPKKIGVLGHSQGATIAPMAAAQSDDIGFVIMLAGMGVGGDEVMVEQKRLVAMSQGIEGEHLDRMVEHQRKLIGLVKKGATKDALKTAIEESLDVDLTEEQRSQVGEDLKKDLIEAGLASVTAQFIVSLVRNDPATYLPKVQVPTLAVWGDKDLQVEPTANEAAVKKHLPGVQTWIVPNMSHNLQETTTGKVEEFSSIEQTVRPDLLEKLTTFIQATTK
jgi:hypothetical protein